MLHLPSTRLLFPPKGLLAYNWLKASLSLAQYTLTDLGAITTTSGGTLTSSSFLPPDASLVYVVVYDVGSAGPNVPTDGSKNYNYANGGTQAPIANDMATFFIYYRGSPGLTSVSCVAKGTLAGMSATLISGSSGTYDAAASDASGGFSGNPHATSNSATVPNELAVGSAGTAISGTTTTQAAGWSSPPSAFSTGSGPVVLSGNKTLIGTDPVTYNPSFNGGLGASQWIAFIDVFEPAPSPILLGPIGLASSEW